MSYLYKKLSSFFITLIFTLFIVPASAQVVINEYSCANTSQVADNFGEYHDWVELYNAGSTSVNLTGYHMSDNAGNPTKYTFPSGTLAPGAFIRMICSGRNMVSGIWFH